MFDKTTPKPTQSRLPIHKRLAIQWFLTNVIDDFKIKGLVLYSMQVVVSRFFCSISTDVTALHLTTTTSHHKDFFTEH